MIQSLSGHSSADMIYVLFLPPLKERLKEKIEATLTADAPQKHGASE
jgi:hypothetical protein